jgi:hypothetical protein
MRNLAPLHVQSAEICNVSGVEQIRGAFSTRFRTLLRKTTLRLMDKGHIAIRSRFYVAEGHIQHHPGADLEGSNACASENL